MRRFGQTSKWKNQTIAALPRERWYEEIGLRVSPSASGGGDGASAIAASHTQLAVAAGSSVKFINIDSPGRLSEHVDTVATDGNVIGVSASRLGLGLVAVTTDRGSVQFISANIGNEYGVGPSLAAPGVSDLVFHPFVEGLACAVSAQELIVFDACAKRVITTIVDSDIASASFSCSGRSLVYVTRTGSVHTVDVTTWETVHTSLVSAVSKRVVVDVTGPKMILSYVSKMRSRAVQIYDVRSPEQPYHAIDFQSTGSKPMVPVTDESRGITYLYDKSSTTMRWLDQDDKLASGVFSTPSGRPAGVALASPTCLDHMAAEINRLFVVDEEKVVSISAKVPRRTYADFHADLYPDVRDTNICTRYSDFVESGGVFDSKTVKVEPGMKFLPQVKEPDSEVKPGSEAIPVGGRKNDTEAIPGPSGHEPEHKKALVPENFDDEGGLASRAASPAPERSETKSAEKAPKVFESANTPAIPSPSKPSQERKALPWSRKYLAGKLLHQRNFYDSLSKVDFGRAADKRMIDSRAGFMAFPIQGGGRVAVHALEKTGRMPAVLDGFENGSELTDFELNPFVPGQLACSSRDGNIRIFEAPGSSSEPRAILGGGILGNVIEIHWNPVAKDILLAACEAPHGECLAIINTATGEVSRKVELSCHGIYSACWSDDGELVAVATKDMNITIVNMYEGTVTEFPSAHRAKRPFKLFWIARDTIGSAGFAPGSVRELYVYRKKMDTFHRIASCQVGQSPSILLPYFDADTSILYLSSKGDRQIMPYHVDLQADTVAIAALPRFAEGAHAIDGVKFFPKTALDVAQVEVARALLLEKDRIEVVGFFIPRKRLDFFQDDIFPPTGQTERPSLEASEWLSSKKAIVNLVELKPSHMTNLSDAPPETQTKPSRSGGGKTATVKHEKDAEQTRLTSIERMLAKADLGQDDLEVYAKGNRNQSDYNDDDWGD